MLDRARRGRLRLLLAMGGPDAARRREQHNFWQNDQSLHQRQVLRAAARVQGAPESVERDAVAAARLDRILATAQGVNGFVRVDAEYANSLDQMHEIVAAARAAGRPVGAVVQANMQRSAADLTRLIAGGIPVRLVKGAYDPGAEGVGDIEAVNAAYLALAERLIATNLPIAFGTHDDRIISKLSASAQSRGEIQLLYGVRTELAEQLVAKGWRVRIYTPYGPDWWPYSLRRMAERPANLRFVLRSLVGR